MVALILSSADFKGQTITVSGETAGVAAAYFRPKQAAGKGPGEVNLLHHSWYGKNRLEMNYWPVASKIFLIKQTNPSLHGIPSQVVA
ncbi:MAG: hypothetical protein IPM85_02755 [Chitinophagaceae bacterium]|nr:hypothetical protein [Chitinophagaceae bacterium]